MPKRFIDRRGEKYGKLTVMELVAHGKHSSWLCHCDCGKDIIVSGSNLVTGNTTSCGCSRIQHGLSKTKIHHVWRQMIYRCENPNDAFYHNYGARGIKVCERWKDFELFFEDMGFPPKGGTLDRIDNDGHYEHANCRWATRKEQNNNKRTNIMLTAFGKTQSLQMWSEEYKMPPRTLHNRIFRAKWPIEKALTEAS